MPKKNICLTFCLLLVFLFSAAAGERSESVDLYILIDKSLSMAEKNRFDGVQEWVRDELIGQMLIPGDRIHIYAFYGKTEKLADMEIRDEADFETIRKTVASIVPDGGFTDIGSALDRVKKDIAENSEKDRFVVTILLTDMIQEAPYSSPYRGKDSEFANEFLAADRIISHGPWFEIAITMDDQEEVAERSRKLYTIIKSAGPERTAP